MKHIDYQKNPFIVIWEVTRACALSCVHCRAEAQFHRYENELDTEEGKALIREIQAMDNPILVFTGGDPLMREDLFELTEYAASLGMRVSMTPSATPRVTHDAVKRAKAAGLSRWAFSIDGPDAQTHDYFRGTRGSFDRTVRGISYFREEGMSFQINTTVTEYNVDRLPEMATLVESLGVSVWTLFFLVPTGRGSLLQPISPERHEEVLKWAFALQETVPFIISTTEAQFYRRVARQENQRRNRAGLPPIGHPHDDLAKAPRGTNDGNGFVFISHTGDVQPSGFLPITCGNVRTTPLADIYRHHPTFKALRDPDTHSGKCGYCEYRYLCGGSRARAYAVTGDFKESEPYCIYQPKRPLISQ
ncbi:TIGR04053 family radical SAM/SPASM domain-containing protein [Exiguobacterium sp. s22]|uniref:TIGR04053 family radical SAM/SPASM domain-containing protein n=1 Tax=Exiguobacterium sp. s22 TaxID=2751272 RepID=UPI001BE59AD3|nr:TIGR04053 family radical SAM/SPASM domain-containing protein [Exiguobacterium sp. s22]